MITTSPKHWSGQTVCIYSQCRFVTLGSHLNVHIKAIWMGWLMVVQCKPDISRSRISRNWIYRGRMLDPTFWRPRARYFSRNRGNFLDPIRGRQFFAKSAHPRWPLFPVRRRQFFAKSTQAYLSMRAGTHAVRRSATLGGALTPPLCRRVGPS